MLQSRYRFIPISRWIYEPVWGAQVSHDLPFRDGLSGWLDVEIEAKTSILIGGKRRQLDGNNGPTHVDFYTVPDGRFAIPGSGLRGAIRSVLEIAAFGRAAFIDPARYGIRDLTRGAKSIYQKRLVDDEIGWGVAQGWGDELPLSRPRSRAGWLRRITDNDGMETWLLRPCEFARVAVAELEKLRKGIEPKLRPRGPARQRYDDWKRIGGSLPCGLAVGPSRFVARGYQMRKGGYKPTVGVEYADATVPRPGVVATDGTLVFTGKPAAGVHALAEDPGKYYSKKKHEFFFYDESNAEIDVTHLRSDFEFIHEERPGYPAVESWAGCRDGFKNGERIPVFYLTGNLPGGRKPSRSGDIDALGLAMMFRLPHAATTHDLLRNTRSTHTDEGIRDLPTLLFGRAVDRSDAADEGPAPRRGGLKGRVSFEPAVVERKPGETYPVPENLEPTLLGSPKAQFYAAYVRQPAKENGTARGGAYASYTPIEQSDESLVRYPEIAGRKRYPATGGVRLGTPGAGNSRAMDLFLHPLPATTVFRGRVRFRNLKPQELGALIWALRLWAPRWGDRPDLRHKLGMAKPFGLGEVDIRITGARIESNAPDAAGRREFVVDGVGADAVVKAETLADQFVAHMNEAYKTGGGKDSWEKSEPIELLLAMSDPGVSRTRDVADHLDNMSLPDFRTKKQAGEILPDYPRRSASTAGESANTHKGDQAFAAEHPERYASRTGAGQGNAASPARGGEGQNAPATNARRNRPQTARVIRIGDKLWHTRTEQFVRVSRIAPERPNEVEATAFSDGKPYWFPISELESE